MAPRLGHPDAPIKRRTGMSHPKQLICKKELTKLVKYSPQHIARLEKAGLFPQRIQLGQNRVAWLLSEVEAWIEDRLAKRSLKHLTS
jgi:prophage regulatory protein